MLKLLFFFNYAVEIEDFKWKGLFDSAVKSWMDVEEFTLLIDCPNIEGASVFNLSYGDCFEARASHNTVRADFLGSALVDTVLFF
jgi:hypothetical protein